MPDVADYVASLAVDAEKLAERARSLVLALRHAELIDWKPQDLPDGQDIDRTDQAGDPLKVGQRVQVTGSERYGDPTGVVRGAGPDLGDGKQRVHIALDDGDPVYTPSTGRVQIIA